MNKEKINILLRNLMIGICIFVLVIAFITFISATWVIPKQTTCSLMNITDYATCDQLWCNVIDCEYNITLEACICNVNNEVNYSNFSFNYSNYMNNSELVVYLDKKLSELNDSFRNRTFNSNESLNDSTWENKFLKLDAKVENLKDDLINKNTSSKGTDIDPLWFVIGGIILFGGFFMYNKNQKEKEQNPLDKGNAPSIQRKIQSSRQMQREDELDEIKKQLKEMIEQKKQESKPPEKRNKEDTLI